MRDTNSHQQKTARDRGPDWLEVYVPARLAFSGQPDARIRTVDDELGGITLLVEQRLECGCAVAIELALGPPRSVARLLGMTVGLPLAVMRFGLTVNRHRRRYLARLN